MPLRHQLLTLGALVVFSSITMLSLAACGGSAMVSAVTSPRPSVSAAGYAWAVGGGGLIMATSDGGAHWKPQKSGTTSWLASVAFADAAHGWAVGGQTDGEPSTYTELVLSTRDGGAHWTSQTLGRPGGYLATVACTDSSHIWAGGADGSDAKGGVIFASTDGGATWVRQYTDNSASDTVISIAFADTSHGWALTAHNKVLATIDGGAHWVRQRIPDPGHHMFMQVSCSDADHCWIVGDAVFGDAPKLLLATSDGSASWQALTTPKSLVHLSAIRVLDAHRIVLGGYGAKGKTFIATSTNGGASWRIGSGKAPMDFIFALAGGESGALWAVGDHQIAASTDGGVTWAVQATTPGFESGQSLSVVLDGIACPRTSGSASTNP